MASKTIQAVQILWTGTPTGTLPVGTGAYPIPTTGTITGVAIRLSEDDITGAVWGAVSGGTSFVSNLIAQKGIANVTASADLRRGGDMASYEGVDIALVNAEQLFLALKACGINLQGCPMQLWEFTGQAGSLAGAQIFTGICDDVSWTATGLTVKCKNSRMRRNAAMFTQINNGQYETVADLVSAVNNNETTCNYPYANDDEDGKMVPISFGALLYAKMVRTADMVIPLTMNGGGASGSLATILSYMDASGNAKALSESPAVGDIQYRYLYSSAPDFGDIEDFPLCGPNVVPLNGQTTAYYIKIGDALTYSGIWQKRTCATAGVWPAGGGWISWGASGFTTAPAAPFNQLTVFSGQYLMVVDGSVQKNNGSLITAAYFNPSGSYGYNYGAVGASVNSISDAGVIKIQLANLGYFTDENGNGQQLNPNNTVNPVAGAPCPDSWVQVQTKNWGYTADEWPLTG
jgi:hypothetical protein